MQILWLSYNLILLGQPGSNLIAKSDANTLSLKWKQNLSVWKKSERLADSACLIAASLRMNVNLFNQFSKSVIYLLIIRATLPSRLTLHDSAFPLDSIAGQKIAFFSFDNSVLLFHCQPVPWYRRTWLNLVRYEKALKSTTDWLLSGDLKSSWQYYTILICKVDDTNRCLHLEYIR